MLEEYKKKNHFMDHNDINVEYVSEEKTILYTEVKKCLTNLHGYVHGGLFFTMADCAAGLLARQDGRDYVTQSANINYISNRKDGKITATAEVISRRTRITIIRVKIQDADQVLLADVTVNMFCV